MSKSTRPGQLVDGIEEDWERKIVKLAEEITKDTARDGEPLDGDEVEFIARRFWVELDYRQGNLTEDEYEERLGLLERGEIW